MRTATGLALVAIGAILAFAVTSSPSFFNFQIAGWVLILTGVAGLLVPRRGYGWLRRRVVVRRPRGTAVDPDGEPRTRGAGLFRRGPIADPTPPVPGSPVPGGTLEQAIPGTAQPTEETVEEFFEE
jgi:hypothetical protein